MPSRYIKSATDYRHKRHTGKKAPPTGTDADLNLVSMLPLFMDEDKARAFMETKRWADGRKCPHCQCGETYKLTAKPGSKSPVRPGVYKCKECRKQFTVRVGTVFEDSKLPIRVWLHAIFLMCTAKNGISSHELARALDITQKSAWFVEHRVRESMKQEPMAGMLGKSGGIVEVDETWCGARRPRIKGTRKGPTGAKAPVLALVERGGNVVAYPIASTTANELKGAVRRLVDKSATIMTDEHRCYQGIGKEFDGGHLTVHHGSDEYVRQEKRGDEVVTVTTNSVEGFFSRIKRSHVGVHHHMSRKHLARYVTEAAFKYNSRRMADGSRMVAAIKGAEGRRLMYRQPVEK
ncbi:MAG: IS1595 family transposase [Planctomycetota bacterium]